MLRGMQDESVASLRDRPRVEERNALNWPIGDFSYTDRYGITHDVLQWYDDSIGEVFLRCRRSPNDHPDAERAATTCLECLRRRSG